MRGDIVMTEDREEKKSNLNNDEPHINRGVELLLRNRRKVQEKPKTFQIKFGNMISIFKRDIVFHFNFYLDVRKK
jgi:chaperonin cofactor prefoldin